jgi:hypothetical protein
MAPPIIVDGYVPAGWESNRDGRLHPEQQAKLVQQLTTAAKPVPASNDVLAALVLLGIFAGPVILMTDGGMRSFVATLTVILAVLITVLMLRGQRTRAAAGRLEQARWSALLQDVQAGRYQVTRYEGPVEFAVYPQEQGQTYALVIPSDVLTIPEATYTALSAYASGLIVYYLTSPVLTLLSVEQIPVAEPPTDAQLAQVTGIGDDGELIYVEQDVPPRGRSEQA